MGSGERLLAPAASTRLQRCRRSRRRSCRSRGTRVCTDTTRQLCRARLARSKTLQETQEAAALNATGSGQRVGSELWYRCWWLWCWSWEESGMPHEGEVRWSANGCSEYHSTKLSEQSSERDTATAITTATTIGAAINNSKRKVCRIARNVMTNSNGSTASRSSTTLKATALTKSNW